MAVEKRASSSSRMVVTGPAAAASPFDAVADTTMLSSFEIASVTLLLVVMGEPAPRNLVVPKIRVGGSPRATTLLVLLSFCQRPRALNLSDMK